RLERGGAKRLKNRQRLQKRRTLRPRSTFEHFVVVKADANGVFDRRLELGEVAGLQQPSLVRAERRQPLGDVALVEPIVRGAQADLSTAASRVALGLDQQVEQV